MPKKEKKSLIHYMIQIFMLLNVPFKKWNDSTTFVNWELLVLRQKTYCHSHVIIQSLNINLLHQILQHNHNSQISHILHFQKTKNWKNISSASIRQNMIVYMSLTNMVVEWCTRTV
jgi:hypothetical protein